MPGDGPGGDGAGTPPLQRAALVMVLMVTLHSLLEYPLWYSYFLLPTSFAFGLCLAEPADGAPHRLHRRRTASREHARC